MKTILLILAAIMMCLSGCNCNKKSSSSVRDYRPKNEDTDYLRRKVACGKYNGVCLCVHSRGGIAEVSKEACE